MNINSFLSTAPENERMAIAQEEVRKYIMAETESCTAMDSPRKVAEYIRVRALGPDEFKQEVFGVIAFDIRMRPRLCKVLFRGLMDSVQADYKVLFQSIFQCDAPITSIIIFHTHPSGECDPSEADIIITEDAVKKCRLVGLKCLDHLIFSQYDNYSVADNHYTVF